MAGDQVTYCAKELANFTGLQVIYTINVSAVFNFNEETLING